MADARPTDGKDERAIHQHQTILTSDRIEIRATEVEEGLFEQIHRANKDDDACEEYRQAIAQGVDKLHGIKLEQCRVVDGALFKRGLL